MLALHPKSAIICWRFNKAFAAWLATFKSLPPPLPTILHCTLYATIWKYKNVMKFENSFKSLWNTFWNHWIDLLFWNWALFQLKNRLQWGDLIEPCSNYHAPLNLWTSVINIARSGILQTWQLLKSLSFGGKKKVKGMVNCNRKWCFVFCLVAILSSFL